MYSPNAVENISISPEQIYVEKLRGNLRDFQKSKAQAIKEENFVEAEKFHTKIQQLNTQLNKMESTPNSDLIHYSLTQWQNSLANHVNECLKPTGRLKRSDVFWNNFRSLE
jgi:hypothetical protein